MKDCRDCVQWETCPCGKTGHERGTSIGYSIGECKDYAERKQTWQECQIFETKGIIDEAQSCRCPVCNKYLTTPYRYYFSWYKYCPNCGTRLYREGEEE